VTRRTVAFAATLGVAVSIFVTPWFALYRYEPNGWHATWWARLALLLAVANLALMALDLIPPLRITIAALTFIAISFRLIWPPDFGLAFDGLDVPTARRAGVWIALILSLVALGAELLRARRAN
jgi:hypothetical protein